MHSSRELVHRALKFARPERVPRDLWVLPWAAHRYPDMLKKLEAKFPSDIVNAPAFLLKQLKLIGSIYDKGEYFDEWGCRFVNVQRGVYGKIKEPLVKGENWNELDKIKVPYEVTELDVDKINEFCDNTDKFVLATVYSPRLFERLQFIRGTEQLFRDLIMKPEGLFEVIEKVHQYDLKWFEAWGETDVDGLFFMDDWGSQNSLMINPTLWVEMFKPKYKKYIEIIHKYGKKAFMHSDGYILDIIPHLIELGLDALNSQMFCMGLDRLSQFRGKLTFWGELDRQQLLSSGTLDDINNAVRLVKEHLWEDGGCIAQCEFGFGSKPENIYHVFEAWEVLDHS